MKRHGPTRYRMTIEHQHHAMSGIGGEATVVPVEDVNGPWVSVEEAMPILEMEVESGQISCMCLECRVRRGEDA